MGWPGPSSELLRARTDGIEMPDIVWVGPEVDPPPSEQNGEGDKAVNEDQKRLVRFNSVEEAVQIRSPPSKVTPEARQ